EFKDVCHADCFTCMPGEGITFETILFEGSNDIKIQYEDAFFGTGDGFITAANNGASATTGLSKDGTKGLGYSWASAAITDGLAVLYSPTMATDGPTATPTVSASPTATASATATETPTPTTTETPTPTLQTTETPTDTPTATPGASATASATPTPTPTAT